MKTLEDLDDVFNIFHDGSISAWSGNKDKLTLSIDSQYLAERIDSSFNQFYVELIQINTLEFEPWMNPIELPAQLKVEVDDIFKAELEILSADIKEDLVVVICNQHNLDFNYCGGLLKINCQEVKVFDQKKNILTIEILEKICNEYWNRF